MQVIGKYHSGGELEAGFGFNRFHNAENKSVDLGLVKPGFSVLGDY